jgi:alpha-1,3/alpha-1,6-mannosyltransferase
LFVSLNRFEPKKNIALAIRAMTKLKSCLSGSDYWNDVHLVVAGGYDPRLESCVQYLEELKNLVKKEGLTNHVSFLLSPKDSDKISLLAKCLALVYTPSDEHFGIVPLEAMYLGKPVIAVDSGGPRETVVDSSTGFLCPAIESHFGVAMARLVKDPKFARSLGERGQTRFQNHFSFEEFSKAWEAVVTDLMVCTSSKKHPVGNTHKHKD